MPYAAHIPGYNYCGPLTYDYTKKPVNELDAACRRHDLKYLYYDRALKDRWDRWKYYILYSKADEEFLREVRYIPGAAAAFSRFLFTSKQSAFTGLMDLLAGLNPSRKRGLMFKIATKFVPKYMAEPVIPKSVMPRNNPLRALYHATEMYEYDDLYDQPSKKRKLEDRVRRVASRASSRSKRVPAPSSAPTASPGDGMVPCGS